MFYGAILELYLNCIPHSVRGMIIAKVYCMNVTSTRLINFRVHSLNNAQLTILLNRERRKLLLARGFHTKHADISEIQHSIHELERILRQREMQGRNFNHPVRHR